MTRYLRLLTEEIEHETRQRVQRVSAALFQGLSWLHESGDPRLVRIVERHGWGLGRLEVVCDLAAFTQIVVGPLASSGLVRAKSGVGRTIPVRHGVDLRFDERHARDVMNMLNAFVRMADRLNIRMRWLRCSHARDLAFLMDRALANADGQ